MWEDHSCYCKSHPVTVSPPFCGSEGWNWEMEYCAVILYISNFRPLPSFSCFYSKSNNISELHHLLMNIWHWAELSSLYFWGLPFMFGGGLFPPCSSLSLPLSFLPAFAVWMIQVAECVSVLTCFPRAMCAGEGSVSFNLGKEWSELGRRILGALIRNKKWFKSLAQQSIL